jgi:hypothetical protein
MGGGERVGRRNAARGDFYIFKIKIIFDNQLSLASLLKLSIFIHVYTMNFLL